MKVIPILYGLQLEEELSGEITAVRTILEITNA